MCCSRSGENLSSFNILFSVAKSCYKNRNASQFCLPFRFGSLSFSRFRLLSKTLASNARSSYAFKKGRLVIMFYDMRSNVQNPDTIRIALLGSVLFSPSSRSGFCVIRIRQKFYSAIDSAEHLCHG